MITTRGLLDCHGLSLPSPLPVTAYIRISMQRNLPKAAKERGPIRRRRAWTGTRLRTRRVLLILPSSGVASRKLVLPQCGQRLQALLNRKEEKIKNKRNPYASVSSVRVFTFVKSRHCFSCYVPYLRDCESVAQEWGPGVLDSFAAASVRCALWRVRCPTT